MTTLRVALAGLVLVVLAFAALSLGLYARLARVRREQLEAERAGGAAAARMRPPGAP